MRGGMVMLCGSLGERRAYVGTHRRHMMTPVSGPDTLVARNPDF